MHNIEEQLQERKIPFELIYHEKPVLRTAQEGADYFGIGMGQTAPTLILKTDKSFHALIISGDRGRVDFKVIKKMLGFHDVRMASPEEIETMGYVIGTIPIFGLKMPYIIDQRLLQYDFIYGGTGEMHWTLKVSPKALMKLNQVVGTIDEIE